MKAGMSADSTMLVEAHFPIQGSIFVLWRGQKKENIAIVSINMR
jgi:hypothetical protein